MSLFTDVFAIRREWHGTEFKLFWRAGSTKLALFCFSKVTWHCGSLNKYKVIRNQTSKQEMTSVLTVFKIL